MGKVVGLTISSGNFSMLKKACVASFGGSNDGLSFFHFLGAASSGWRVAPAPVAPPLVRLLL